MIDIDQLRQALGAVQPEEVAELLDRLEAAEKDIALKERVIDSLGSALNAAANERDALRTELAVLRSSMTFRTSLIGRIEAERDALQAKVEAMERQEPVAQVGVHKTGGNAGIMWSARPLNEFDSLPLLRDGDRLYLAPGAQPAQMVVAYLDLGVGGYMDIGTDLTDEALAALPKGRHMLGIVGTYGVEGYIQAQPAPSVPEGWQLVPTAESRHPGIYKMLGALHAADNTPGMSEWESYRAMLSEAPEAKP